MRCPEYTNEESVTRLKVATGDRTTTGSDVSRHCFMGTDETVKS